MSYIKPLNASMGPKQTKCELNDETIYCNWDEYITTLTTTRTPDVPSGNVFSVKTRTCVMWAGGGSNGAAPSTRVIVSCGMEWFQCIAYLRSSRFGYAVKKLDSCPSRAG